MKRASFNILFIVKKSRITRDGQTPIFVRVTINSVRCEASLSLKTDPCMWNSTIGKSLGKDRFSLEINKRLDVINVRMMQIYREKELDGVLPTPQTIIDAYFGRDTAPRHTLIEVFKEHNEKCQKLSGIDFAPATVGRYETTLKHTLEFMRHTYKKEDIYLDELSKQFIEDFEFYMKTERKCGHNTTTKYLKNFKKITRIAIEKDWLKKDPFAGLHFHLEDVERDFLEAHEINKILEKQIDIPRLAQVRDIFVFCCYSNL